MTMAKRYFLPRTVLGKWGVVLFGVALLTILVSMAFAYLATGSSDSAAYNVLGVLAPLFLLITLAGIVVSWLAILWKKERGIFSIVLTIIVTAAALFTFVAEVIEVTTMVNG